MRHSLGTWQCKIFEDGAYIVADGPVDDPSASRVIASLGPQDNPQVSLANAALICAAPALLAALESVTGEAAFEGLPESKQAAINTAIEQARSGVCNRAPHSHVVGLKPGSCAIFTSEDDTDNA